MFSANDIKGIRIPHCHEAQNSGTNLDFHGEPFAYARGRVSDGQRLRDQPLTCPGGTTGLGGTLGVITHKRHVPTPTAKAGLSLSRFRSKDGGGFTRAGPIATPVEDRLIG